MAMPDPKIFAAALAAASDASLELADSVAFAAAERLVDWLAVHGADLMVSAEALARAGCTGWAHYAEEMANLPRETVRARAGQVAVLAAWWGPATKPFDGFVEAARDESRAQAAVRGAVDRTMAALLANPPVMHSWETAP